MKADIIHSILLLPVPSALKAQLLNSINSESTHFLSLISSVSPLLFNLVGHIHTHFYSLNPSMYYSIAITVMEKAHIDIHPRNKKSGFKRLFIRQYDYFRM